MIDRVLVTGGTGKTGRQVARLLVERGVEARIATRHPTFNNQIRFDWDDRSSYDAAITEVNSIYLVAPTDHTEHLAAMRPLLEKAVDCGIGRLVLLSASSLDEGGPMMGEVHAWLHANAPSWTVLRPSWFMQNFTTQHLPSILNEGCIYSATHNGRVPFIDAADIAAVAVEALVDPSFASGERILTGPEALTYDEAALLITSASGHVVRHCRLSVSELSHRYASFGIPEHYAATLARMDEEISHGREDRTTDVVKRVTGRRPTSLTNFLQIHCSDFATP